MSANSGRNIGSALDRVGRDLCDESEAERLFGAELTAGQADGREENGAD